MSPRARRIVTAHHPAAQAPAAALSASVSVPPGLGDLHGDDAGRLGGGQKGGGGGGRCGWGASPLAPYVTWGPVGRGTSTLLALPTGVSGVAYRPRFFHPVVFNETFQAAAAVSVLLPRARACFFASAAHAPTNIHLWWPACLLAAAAFESGGGRRDLPLRDSPRRRPGVWSGGPRPRPGAKLRHSGEPRALRLQLRAGARETNLGRVKLPREHPAVCLLHLTRQRESVICGQGGNDQQLGATLGLLEAMAAEEAAAEEREEGSERGTGERRKRDAPPSEGHLGRTARANLARLRPEGCVL